MNTDYTNRRKKRVMPTSIPSSYVRSLLSPVCLSILLAACGGGSSDNDSANTDGSTAGSTTGDTGTTTGGGTTGTTDGSTDGTTDGSTTGDTGGTSDGTTTGDTGGTTDGATTGGTGGGTGGSTDGSTTGATDGTTGGTTTGGGGISQDDRINPALLALESTGDAITVDNYETVLTSVIALYRGDDVIRLAGEFRDLEVSLSSGLGAFNELNITEFPYDRILQCPDGGLLKTEYQDSEDPLVSSRHVFEGCIIGSNFYTGTYSHGYTSNTSQGVTKNKSSYTGGFSVASVSESGEADYPAEEIAGGVSRTSAIDEDGNTGTAVEFFTTFYQMALSETALYNVTLTLVGHVESSIPDVTLTSLQTTAAVRLFDPGIMIVETPQNTFNVNFSSTSQPLPFIGDDTVGEFSTGQIEVSNVATRTRVVFSADNGDPDSFDVVLYDSDGNVQALTVPWSDAYRISLPDSVE